MSLVKMICIKLQANTQTVAPVLLTCPPDATVEKSVWAPTCVMTTMSVWGRAV
jgi:hypothetical protein